MAFELPGGEDAQLFLFEKFGSLNTKATRPAIKDEEFSWVENWFPIGDGNLRTIYDRSGNFFTASQIIVYVFNGSLSADKFGIGVYLFFVDGTAFQLEALGGSTPLTSTIFTFFDLFTSSSVPQCVQWQDKYLLIVANSTKNGYFIWNGTNLFQAGTLSPDINITDGGQNYTSAPTVIAYGGAGSGATFTATVSNGAVTDVEVDDPGSGYLLNDTVQLQFTGGGSDTTATANATIATTGGVGAVDIQTGGTGYTTSSVLSFSGGGGSGAEAVITGLNNGVITEVTITNPGQGYTSAPTVAASVGSGFTASVEIRRGQLASVNVLAGGSGYTGQPEVQISAPDSDTLPLVQATAAATISGGAVTGFTVINPGLGYNNPPTISLIGGNGAASATASLMPFGISGTTIETYNGSVWIANGTKVSFTAPGSTSNFSTSAGGGSFQSTDNFLKQQFVALKQANGFLYLLGDSSINVISNVQTTVAGTFSTTTFNNSNVDPQIGCGWRDSVCPFNRALVFANPNGVYALYGGAAQRVSSPLDGLFNNAQPFFTPGATGIDAPSAALASLFSIPVYMLNFKTVDFLTGATRYLMTIWDGQKWFIGSQSTVPIFISYTEDFSALTAWGTDSINVFQMYTTPSNAITKTFQTRLRSDPAIIYDKQVNTLYGTGISNSGASGNLSVSIDTERGLGAAKTLPFGTSLSLPITGPMGAAEYGRLIGMTASTTDADMTLVNLGLLFANYSPKTP